MGKIQNQPGMIWPVVTYAPTAATKPNIAAHPLKRSASGVIFFLIIVKNYNTFIYLCKEIHYKSKGNDLKFTYLRHICIEIYPKNIVI